MLLLQNQGDDNHGSMSIQQMEACSFSHESVNIGRKWKRSNIRKQIFLTGYYKPGLWRHHQLFCISLMTLLENYTQFGGNTGS